MSAAGVLALRPLALSALVAAGLAVSGCEPTLVRDNPHDPGSITFVDQDNDQYGEQDDCNDTNASIYPGATEVCNDTDDNCDDSIDEGLPVSTWYADQDGDGYGDEAVTSQKCTQPDGYVENAEDCLDNDKDVHPNQKDLCNELDDDCDGRQDEDEGPDSYYVDADKDGFGDPESSVISCDKPSGTVANSDDCNDEDTEINPQASEACNGVDDDCNELTDDGLDFGPWYPDQDGDSYGDSSSSVSTCAPEEGWVDTKGDCNDASASQFPGAEEVCNQQDDNCSEEADEGLQVFPYYSDQDSDGYGSGSTVGSSCATPVGYSAFNTDCDEQSGEIYPGAVEIPYDGFDQDCDGLDLSDVDGDGVDATEVEGTDCDDTDPSISPLAEEVCNLIDDNCNELIDETSEKFLYHEDRDADSYGDPRTSAEYCKSVEGWVTNADDCDDNEASIYPGAEEVCNLVDDNCDAVIDESFRTQIYYQDSDSDSYGMTKNTVEACMQPEGYASTDGDCDDAASSINPGESEAFDLQDNDCDGLSDDQIDLSLEVESTLEATDSLFSRKLLGVGQPAVDTHGLFAQLGTSSVPSGVAYYSRDILGKTNAAPTALFLVDLRYAGFDLAVSDFDGDGFDDVAISLLSPVECAVYIFAGGPAGFSGSYAKDQASYLYTGSGSDKCGYSLAPVTGVYTDGKALLALGAPGAGNGSGSVVILDIMTGQSSDSWPQRVISGRAADGALGSRLLTAPNAELWVGEPGANGGSGLLYRVSLPEEGSLVSAGDVQQAIFKWVDSSVAERPAFLSQRGLGYGDLNGDNLLDLVIPSDTFDSLGAVYVIFSANKLTGAWSLDQGELAQVTYHGLSSTTSTLTTRVGVSAVTVGDLNGDGYDELMVGAVRTEGSGGDVLTYPELFLVPGDATPGGLSLPGGGVPSFTVPEPVSSALVELSSAGSADVDGDSFRELFFQVAGFPLETSSLQGRVTTPYSAN